MALPLSDFTSKSSDKKAGTVNGHVPRPFASSKKRTYVDMDDDEPDLLKSFRKGGPKMNGHSTPNGKESRKKPRHSSGLEVNGSREGNAALQEQRRQLPIFSGGLDIQINWLDLTVSLGRETLIREVREHDVTILLGETGSGKTTRTYV
jgi:HrpA-like RNA helicase